MELEPLQSTMSHDPFMAELLLEFAGTLPERVQGIRDAHASGDHELLQRLAHQLKGAGGGFGYDAITAAARLVESGARDGVDDSQLLVAIQALDDICQRAVMGAEALDAAPPAGV